MSRAARVPALLVLATLLAAPAASRAASAAASVASLEGEALAISAQNLSRPLREGSGVFEGETVQTAADASLTLSFTDGTQFELGESASLRIDRYSHAAEAEQSLAASVFKGVFRFVTGLVARSRPRAMSVKVGVATIGIRGTRVVGEVRSTPENISARVILLEPEEGGALHAIEVANAYGSVLIEEPGYGTDIPDNHSPPSPPRRMGLRTIENLMRTLRSVQRIRVPRLR